MRKLKPCAINFIPQTQVSIIGRVIKILITAIQIDKKKIMMVLSYFAFITSQDFNTEKAEQLMILDLFKWFIGKMFKNIATLLIYSLYKIIKNELHHFITTGYSKYVNWFCDRKLGSSYIF